MATRRAENPAPRIPKAKASRLKTAARRPGRPSGSINPQEQRNRLLDTAIVLFARQGVAETTLSSIAREAGVTPAMVHYYFSSRDQLLDALIDERIQPRRVALSKVFDANAGDPMTVILQLAERLMQTATEQPWFPSLWMREVISDNGMLRQRIIERHGQVHFKQATDCIAHWQSEGKLNPHMEPSLLFVSMFGLIVLPLIASKSWSNSAIKRKLTPEDIARHAVAILSHGVGPVATRKGKR